MKASLPPYLQPVDILEPGADEKIREQGRIARELAETHYDAVCTIHGVFAFGIIEAHLDREEMRHRSREGCTGIIRLKEKK